MLEQIVEGITAGCIEADCALLGGETAILPDIYAPGDYDLAGFCVGVAERHRVIDGKAIEPGDVAIGVASTGLHSNGFSLARKIAFEIGGCRGRAITSRSWARPSARRCWSRRGSTSARCGAC